MLKRLFMFKFLPVTVALLAGCVLSGGVVRAADEPKIEEKKEEGWVSLFDGKSLNGWKVNESPDSFKVEDGAIVAQGNRSHLFYTGDEKPFVNFEFKAEVMTLPNSNSGLYIHTKYQDNGWPKFGYECQVNNTQSDRRKTGSLYSVVDVFLVDVQDKASYVPSVTVNKNNVMLNVAEAPAKDNQWFTYHIVVNGKRVTTRINDRTMVDYTEPDGKQAGNDFTRVLDQGTFAIQAHDPGSRVLYRNIQVKRLP
jgi:hypothetical protein